MTRVRAAATPATAHSIALGGGAFLRLVALVLGLALPPDGRSRLGSAELALEALSALVAAALPALELALYLVALGIALRSEVRASILPPLRDTPNRHAATSI